jgi:MFS family permease
MGVPPELVQRSAAARAEANGTSIDDILSAWAGDAPPPEPTTAPEPAQEAETEATPVEEAPAEEPAPTAVAVIEEPAVDVPGAAEPKPVEDEELEPVALGTRVKTAVRVGAWTGAALGVVGFLAASAFWAPNASVVDAGPFVQVNPTNVIIGVALVSVFFGAVVAGMSRAATAWTNPAMQLSSSRAGTAWLGAAIGLILGVIAGAMLNGFGTAVEASDPAMVQLPILPTLLVMVIGGAILGAATALLPQLLGVPVAVEDSDSEEVTAVKSRLGNAMGIPVVGLSLLLLLVLPFAYALIESNHLAPGLGGAVVAVVAASGILGFAALAGSKPEMRISFGDVMWALLGIGALLVIIISVLLYAGGGGEEHSEDPAGEEAAIVQVL